ncbi:peptidoglycan/LPS O-acetylase OafA/YrhL [Inhella inkyongensis]|uniref:Peptidoglycan/LPS O-acetylase OafA/YrhL n=1 Tax=Inhella inkyongensis TaxID=392593 RepID=A0A840S086_9BURK|nr:peptidoglycan/LPS O-acetylase OafA/YrhL [Inhella inkyongensis]
MLLFHAYPAALPGGYLGVDIFFVISGYLLTGIALRERAAGSFRWGDFYGRRVRRIVPALLLVLIVSLLLGACVLHPRELKLFAQSLTATLLWVSNLYFWRQSDYFAQSAAQQPLLHTWSLAVEEQFYLLFPLGLWWLWRRPGQALRLAIVVLLGLLGFAAWAQQVFPTASFYVLPTRAWQLMAGVTLAVWHQRDTTMVSQGRWLQVLGLVALALALGWPHLLAPILALGPQLTAVSGAALLLQAGRVAAGPQWLASRPLVGIGLISYSLYLWHQPLLSLAHLRWGEAALQRWLPALLTLAGLLAWLSWRFVERPWRRHAQGKILPLRHLGYGAVLLLLASLWLQFQDGSWRPASSPQREWVNLHYEYADEYRLGSCFLNYWQGPAHWRTCAEPGQGGPRVLLWGDSYAAHLRAGLLARSDQYGELVLRAATACPPLLAKAGDRSKCAELQRDMLAQLQRSPPDVLMLSARWTPELLERLDATLYQVRAAGVRELVVMGNTPRWRGGLPGRLAGTLDAQGRAPKHLMPDHVEAQLHLRQQLRLRAEAAGARFVDLWVALCPEERLCATTDDAQQPLYWDEGHLTRLGSERALRDLSLPRAQ